MLLAIDTSTTHLGLAIFDGEEVRSEICWTSPNRHTTALAPAVKQMLETLEIDQKKIKCIAAALGPGSFTSLRVGVSFAKGMALGLGVPVIGIPTLDILAAAQPIDDMPLCAFLQAGRGKYAACFYKNKRNRWESDGEISIFTIDSFCSDITENTLLCGEFTPDMRTELRKRNKNIRPQAPSFCLRRPGFLAEAAWKIFEKGKYPPTASVSPIYLHTNDPIPDFPPVETVVK